MTCPLYVGIIKKEQKKFSLLKRNILEKIREIKLIFLKNIAICKDIRDKILTRNATVDEQKPFFKPVDIYDIKEIEIHKKHLPLSKDYLIFK